MKFRDILSIWRSFAISMPLSHKKSHAVSAGGSFTSAASLLSILLVKAIWLRLMKLRASKMPRPILILRILFESSQNGFHSSEISFCMYVAWRALMRWNTISMHAYDDAKWRHANAASFGSARYLFLSQRLFIVIININGNHEEEADYNFISILIIYNSASCRPVLLACRNKWRMILALISSLILSLIFLLIINNFLLIGMFFDVYIFKRSVPFWKYAVTSSFLYDNISAARLSFISARGNIFLLPAPREPIFADHSPIHHSFSHADA